MPNINSHSNIELYPNPTNDKVTLVINEVHRNISIVIKDVRGGTVLEEAFEGKRNISLNLESLVSGIYFMSVIFDDEISVVKLIKD